MSSPAAPAAAPTAASTPAPAPAPPVTASTSTSNAAKNGDNDSTSDLGLMDTSSASASDSASGASTPSHIPTAVLQSPSIDPTFCPSYPINPPPTDRPVRIYCDGIYDLFHYGHARALQQAKQAFPNVYLLVGVCSDKETHARKGKTVMHDYERYQAIAHCKWVDEVVEDAPWIITQEFLDKYRIDYVAHDDIPYESGDVKDVYAFVKQQGRFFPTKRTDGVSTSDLITRIVRDYDKYLRRNLARGVSPRELNIGFFTEKRLAVEKSVEEIKNEIKAEVAEWKDEWRETVRTWESKSSQYVKGFVGMFKSGVKLLRMRSPINSAPASPTRRTRAEFEADNSSDEDDHRFNHRRNYDDDSEDDGDGDGDVRMALSSSSSSSAATSPAKQQKAAASSSKDRPKPAKRARIE
ncbi:hypothetical protein BCR44DRAFT_66417 [Catenaria anguillulae PL171]|uniref:choline-phosphate cytidylyltransferase n=1 Tax=Catenaria anguillulae PL171 TaxID=765915 RepID=A0A1Y2HFW4_9FUNG|nr:hypothetical protein BCR44DRAFT_66417 [Catenaria anguillulae PL171]